MPRIVKELSALEVKRLKHPGGVRHTTVAVGGVSGLLLQITPTGGRTWILRTSVAGKRREIGLGGFPNVTLSQARERAREAKDKILQGIDPVEERKALRAALIEKRQRSITFSEAVERYLDAKLSAFKNEKHQSQWRNTLQTYALPHIGSMVVQNIEVQDVLRVLNQTSSETGQSFWHEKTETASRLRGRIEAVLSWATVVGHRTGTIQLGGRAI